MNPSLSHPAAFFLQIAIICFAPFTPAALAEDSKAVLAIRSINPASPGKLATGERLNITIDYRNPDARPVHIWARPFTNGKSTVGYRANPSPAYQNVSGTAEGWFYFDSPTEVDEVRVEMKASDGNEVIARASLPIKIQWTGETITAKSNVSSSRAVSPGGTVNSAQVSEDRKTGGATQTWPKLKTGIAQGASVDIKFTAVDGREVDLAKLRGKVVLIDFWATWCGPCIGELPHVLETYRKFHEKGFEIVGISFDQDKAALERLTKEKGMTWPQYFDGKGWKNDYGVKYGIHGIPTMWLIDKQGKIATTNARQELAGQVEKLLDTKQP